MFYSCTVLFCVGLWIGIVLSNFHANLDFPGAVNWTANWRTRFKKPCSNWTVWRNSSRERRPELGPCPLVTSQRGDWGGVRIGDLLPILLLHLPSSSHKLSSSRTAHILVRCHSQLLRFHNHCVVPLLHKTIFDFEQYAMSMWWSCTSCSGVGRRRLSKGSFVVLWHWKNSSEG
jgi:hypothetical protein